MPKVKTDFECGNIGPWSFDGPRRIRFEAPTDGAPWAMWFYFRLSDMEPGAFEFVLTNVHQCLEPTHWDNAKPVMRRVGGNWVPAGDDDVELDLESGEFRFSFQLPGGMVEVAYSYPYTPSMLKESLTNLASHRGVETRYPGKSSEGRSIPYVIMRSNNLTKQPEILWAQAREHAGETSGGYALDGFLRTAVNSSLLEHFEIHALPMIDIDSVAKGRYGKNAPPVDHHMCWCPDSPRQETKLAMELMRKSVAGGRRFRLLINFHSPSPENDSYIVPFNPTLLTERQRLSAEKLHYSLAAHSSPNFPLTADEMSYQRVSSWWDDDIEHRPEAFVLRHFGAETCLLETAYHGSSTNRPSSPEVLRELGASVVRGLESYFFDATAGSIAVYDSLPPIFHRNHRWVLWSVPQHARVIFNENRAWAVGDDP
ncbi:M14-type cytosolic carboxypeptidase, partial [Acidobacteria bacterium AH-259-G07]|nr:M14-type cytosolic carboxypeptidase [Acidobacteria bacterium AH-259-G07]